MRHFRSLLAVFVGLVVVAAVLAAPHSANADTESSGGMFVPIAPYRLVNTSTGLGGSDYPLAPTGVRLYDVLGHDGVPATGVGAVVVDIAASGLSSATSSWMTVWTAGAPRPASSILRLADGELPRSNTVIVKPSSDGKISVYNHEGYAHFNIDVQGYFTADGGTSGGFVPVTPTRVLNTATGLGIDAGPLNDTNGHDVHITGGGVPDGATAVFANVKVQSATVDGSLRIGPGGVNSTTGYASMNYQAGMANDNGMTIQLDDGGDLRLRNLTAGASMDVYIDVQGYFSGDTVLGGSFIPLPQPVIFDSRETTKLAGGATRRVSVGNVPGVPAEDIIGALAVTIRAFNWTSAGAIKVYAADEGAPAVSNLNYSGGSPVTGTSTTSIVAPSPTHEIMISNTGSSAVDVAVSAQGWFTLPYIDDAEDDNPPEPPVEAPDVEDYVDEIGADNIETMSPCKTPAWDAQSTETPVEVDVCEAIEQPEVCFDPSEEAPNGDVTTLCITSTPEDAVAASRSEDSHPVMPDDQAAQGGVESLWGEAGCWSKVTRWARWSYYRKEACRASDWRFAIYVNGAPVGTATMYFYQQIRTNHNNTAVEHASQWYFKEGHGDLAGGVWVNEWRMCRGNTTCTSAYSTRGAATPAWRLLPTWRGNMTVRGSGWRLLRSAAGIEFSVPSQPTLRARTRDAYTPYIRCDSVYYFSNTQGCVFRDVKPKFKMSVSDTLVNEAAQHIRNAQFSISTHPGNQGMGGIPLTRHKWPQGARNLNRAVAQAMCRQLTRPAGKECDEFPFASTFQGCYDSDHACSVKFIDARDNSRAGTKMNQFYYRERILNGDPFWANMLD